MRGLGGQKTKAAPASHRKGHARARQRAVLIISDWERGAGREDEREGREGRGRWLKERDAPKPNWNMRFESVVGSGYALAAAFAFASRSARTAPHFVLLFDDECECEECEWPEEDAGGGGRGRGAALPLKKSARSSSWYWNRAISSARDGFGLAAWVEVGRVMVTARSAAFIWAG